MTPDQLWPELEADAQRISGTGILKRMLAPASVSTMFVGVQRPSLNRLFLLQVPRSQVPSREEIPESRGFELTVQITGEEPPTHATLVLTATDRLYNEVFSAMAENLCQLLTGCDDEKLIAQQFLVRLVEWQQFFENNSPEGLSEEAQRGLYGELYFLQKHLLTDPENFAADVAAWTGPKNRQHDFQFGKSVVEVKTCSAKQHQKLMISSEQQLDDTLVDNLYLYHLSLSAVENHEDTLPALILWLRERIKSDFSAASAFGNALLQQSYLDVQAWRYEKTGYVVRESNVFRVTGDFPRLTERDLPAGVGDVKYSIGVTECRKFSVPMEDVILQLRRGKS
jgi:hypothetical protein